MNIAAGVVLAVSLLFVPRPPPPETSRIEIEITGGGMSARFEGSAPDASAKRTRAVVGIGEVLWVRLKGKARAEGKDEVELTAEIGVGGKTAPHETGRYVFKPGGGSSCSGSVTRDGRHLGWLACDGGEIVIESADERRVKGHLEAQGPCGHDRVRCVYRARFDVRRERSGG